MSVVEFVTAMAAALAVWSGGSALVCGWAAGHAMRAFPWRGAALGFVALAFAMIAIQQGRAVHAYETGIWGLANVLGWVAIGTRVGLAVAFHGLAYIVTRERCGVRGVVALFAAGVVAGLATVVL